MTDTHDFPAASVVGMPSVVGSHVHGPVNSGRSVVRWYDLLTAAQQCVDGFDSESEQYVSAYSYPIAEYATHMARNHCSPRGYGGPAMAYYVWWDIDRAGNLERARQDTITLTQYLIRRYPALEHGIGIWFSGEKGFHVGLDCLPGRAPSPTVPATAKRLALAIASNTGVSVDSAIYDHQRLFRLPNSRHAKSGLYKRLFAFSDVANMSISQICEAARHPYGCDLPEAGEICEQLDRDWREASQSTSQSMTPSGQRIAPPHSTVVPEYVRRFIGFGEIEEPGLHVTLFRCAAALSEAGTPDAVIHGFLSPVAHRVALDPSRIESQIRDGIAHGRRKGAPCPA
jgi:hypothetical protein